MDQSLGHLNQVKCLVVVVLPAVVASQLLQPLLFWPLFAVFLNICVYKEEEKAKEKERMRMRKRKKMKRGNRVVSITLSFLYNKNYLFYLSLPFLLIEYIG